MHLHLQMTSVQEQIQMKDGKICELQEVQDYIVWLSVFDGEKSIMQLRNIVDRYIAWSCRPHRFESYEPRVGSESYRTDQLLFPDQMSQEAHKLGFSFIRFSLCVCLVLIGYHSFFCVVNCSLLQFCALLRVHVRWNYLNCVERDHDVKL